uniref:uncharacterized protein n=1 Tax=Myxine glutinosa TaxID=7769 RepID=UPI00358FB933
MIMVSCDVFVWAAILIATSTLYPRHSVADPSEDSPTEENIKKRCGFSPREISECKTRQCLKSSENCTGESEKTRIECRAEICAKARRTCEEPLNEKLSTFEVCLADKMILVDANCLWNISSWPLHECKYEGYTRVEAKCFKDSWKIRLMEEQHAQEAEADCAVQKCYKNNKECFGNFLRAQVDHPASRRFDINLCAYVQNDTSRCHDTHCFSELEDCRKQVHHAGLIVALLLVCVGVGVLCYVFFLKRRQQHVAYERQHNPEDV